MELSSSLPGPPGTNCHPLLYWDNSLITGKFEDVWLRKCQVQHLRFCALVQTRNVAVFMVNKESYMCWWVKDWSNCQQQKDLHDEHWSIQSWENTTLLRQGLLQNDSVRRDISMSVHNVLKPISWDLFYYCGSLNSHSIPLTRNSNSKSCTLVVLN